MGGRGEFFIYKNSHNPNSQNPKSHSPEFPRLPKRRSRNNHLVSFPPHTPPKEEFKKKIYKTVAIISFLVVTKSINRLSLTLTVEARARAYTRG